MSKYHADMRVWHSSKKVFNHIIQANSRLTHLYVPSLSEKSWGNKIPKFKKNFDYTSTTYNGIASVWDILRFQFRVQASGGIFEEKEVLLPQDFTDGMTLWLSKIYSFVFI